MCVSGCKGDANVLEACERTVTLVAMRRLSLPDYDTALQRIVDAATTLGTRSVPLSQASGCILRCDVVADRDQPPFDRSAMDGFAVRSGSLAAVCWPIFGSVAAGAGPGILVPGTVMRIATGAPLPDGADAVVPIEQAAIKPEGDGAVASFSIASVDAWSNVHRRAVDAGAGQVVLRAGTLLGPHHLAVAATVGAISLRVAARPRVALLTTGDEVRPAEFTTDQLEPHQIRNSNGTMLTALLSALGADLVMQRHVNDEVEQTETAAGDALSQADCVITAGGVSAGQRDRLPDAWRTLGCRTILRGVAIQPGKPLLVVAAAADGDTSLVLGLPGNPVSVLATAHLFVWPVLLKMMGIDAGPSALPWRDVTLAEAVDTQRTRELFRTARLCSASQAQVVAWNGSGDLMHTAHADGLVRLPRQDDPVPAGTCVPFLPCVNASPVAPTRSGSQS